MLFCIGFNFLGLSSQKKEGQILPCDGLKKSQITLSQWILKKGDVVDNADDDDEVSASACDRNTEC
jgi:hypothetical protein